MSEQREEGPSPLAEFFIALAELVVWGIALVIIFLWALV